MLVSKKYVWDVFEGHRHKEMEYKVGWHHDMKCIEMSAVGILESVCPGWWNRNRTLGKGIHKYQLQSNS